MLTKVMFKKQETLDFIEATAKNREALNEYLSEKSAKVQLFVLKTAFAMKYGEGQFLTGGIYDVIDDLDHNVQKYGDKALSLSVKQLEWAAREVNFLFSKMEI